LSLIRRHLIAVLGSTVLGFLLFSSSSSYAGKVEIHDNQLFVDGQAQPQLYGAELQYFRLRGASGPNVPRAKVIATWNQALDRMVEAGMNAISFYIPWDFHEYAEGKFDFTGTVDEDGDGNPDYPSRDVITFIRLIKEHGIKHILVRPGPYINAEWGFLGFGAVPLWFHKKFPNSHAVDPKGNKTLLYSYDGPEFLRYTKIWFTTLYNQVLKAEIGPGKPISFIQVDNETNFQWQSIYSHDYGPRAVQAYQDFLKTLYISLETLNTRTGRHWKTWQEIRPPVHAGDDLAEDQDWYQAQDQSLYVYLAKIRSMWTDLGVKEPSVLFTLAESYNAASHGLLPNYKWRNSPTTGMMTVNLYPKTYETPDQTLLNFPFKADHDVKAAQAASEFYLGHREAWTMGPEIQGGWWRGINISNEARQQTYLTTIGHGLKALFIYYFNEGYNWQFDWLKNAITPYYNTLRATSRYQLMTASALPDIFWDELNATLANQFMKVDARSIWLNGGSQPEMLYFDAPLDADAMPREPYKLVKEIGTKIIAPYGDFLGKAHELEDPVCLIQDADASRPSTVPGVNSVDVQSSLSGGLLGLMMSAGVNARIHQWGINAKSDLLDAKLCKLVVYEDAGFATPELVNTLAQVIDRGGSVLSFIYSGLTNQILAQRPQNNCAALPSTPMNVDGYRCAIGSGALYYAKVPIYDVYNTDFYYQISDAADRRGVFDRVLNETGIQPQVKIRGGGDRTVTFARTSPDGKEVWITAKTARHEGFSGAIEWSGADVKRTYLVSDVLAGTSLKMSGADLATQGFQFTLGDSDSRAYDVRPISIRFRH
jgi:hypothetical protein